MDEPSGGPLAERAASPRLLHLLNGDVTRWKLERSGVPGTLTVWADVLHEGPVPGEEVPRERWLEVRARYITRVGYESCATVLETQRRWEEGLESFREHDEVVIWCEHDLFDQLLLIHHLDWFARRDPGGTRLSLVCIGEYPGMPDFKGLGELAPHQLAALLDTREPVTPRQLELGRAAWRGFTSPDPTRIEELLAGDTAPLPFLARALHRHLAEFPSTANGLSRTEEKTLRALTAGPVAIGELFRAAQREEDAFYIGDASFRTVLRGLANAPVPAVDLEIEEEGNDFLPRGRARLTDAGRAVLAGREDWVRLNGIDRWLSGVHLHGAEAPWRWDAEERRLVPMS